MKVIVLVILLSALLISCSNDAPTVEPDTNSIPSEEINGQADSVEVEDNIQNIPPPPALPED